MIQVLVSEQYEIMLEHSSAGVVLQPRDKD